MNEQQLRRLFRRLVSLSAPLPLATLGAACGGSMTNDSDGSAQTGGSSAAAGSSSTAGSGGTTSEGGSGSGGTRTGTAGSGNVSGSAGAGNTGTGGGSGAGAGGSAGVGGNPPECKGNVQVGSCMPVTATLSRECLPQAVAGQQLPLEKCHQICSVSTISCAVSTVDAGSVSVLCQPGCAVGRRPAGLVDSARCDRQAAAGYFAEIAELEAASVTAFRVLRDELRTSGAPKKLVRAAARAARDEIRHARATGALARRFGGTPSRPTIERRPQRSIEAMAIENAVEGCVRETFGALLATRQAAQARDPIVRATMKRVARDETRHAALSWSVARFLESKLDRTARRNVEQARRAAASDLLSALANEPSVSFADLAGLPAASEALQLASELRRTLWS